MPRREAVRRRERRLFVAMAEGCKEDSGRGGRPRQRAGRTTDGAPLGEDKPAAAAPPSRCSTYVPAHRTLEPALGRTAGRETETSPSPHGKRRETRGTGPPRLS